jgi:hypothetical protein
MSTSTRTVLNKALSRGKAGGEGWVRGRFSESRRIVAARDACSLTLNSLPQARLRGARNGWSLALRTRRVYLNAAEARA